MVQLKKIAAGIGAAAALAYGGGAYAIPVPGAFAESMLDVNNFQFRVGDGTAAISNTLINFVLGAPTGTADLGILQVNSNGSTTSIFNPGNLSDTASINNAPVGTDFDLRSYKGNGAVNAVGPLAPLNVTTNVIGHIGPEFGIGAGNIPGTPNGDTFVQSFAAGASISQGNALTNQDNVIVHSITGIATPGLDGTNNADQGLKSTSFLISVNGLGSHIVNGKLNLETSFDASGFMENLISAQGLTDTNLSWNMSIKDNSTNTNVFNWTPNGNNDGSGLTNCTQTGINANCAEFADTGNMNQSDSNVPIPNFPIIDQFSGNFQAEFDFLVGHLYTLTLTHKTGAHALLAAIPEPATLALLGLGLVGAGVSRRRKS